MKQKKKILLISSCMLLSLIVGIGVSDKTNTAHAEETISKTLQFGSSYNSKKVSSYTDSWTATCDGFTWNIKNFNNNNNSWNYVKAGSKNGTSVATIETSTAITDAISKVVVQIGAVTSSKINSITLSVNGGDAINPTGTIATGDLTFDIDSPVENATYLLTFDCARGSSNGLVQVNQVDYYKGEVASADKYNVKFNANGGTFSDETAWGNKEFDTGTTNTVTLPTSDDLSATPYTYSSLKGWSDGTTEYLPGAEVEVSKATSFSAVYEGGTVTIAQALEICEITGTTVTSITFSTEGTVSSIDTAYDSNYGNITITITDGIDSIKLYRLTGGEDIQVGSKLTVTGNLVTYGTTKEFNSGCTYVLSAELSITISSDVTEIYAYDDGTSPLDATLTYSVLNAENPTITWEVNGNESGIVEYTEIEEQFMVSALKTGSVTVKATFTVEGVLVESNEITINSYYVTTLSTPTNLAFDSATKTLYWDSVTNATEYKVSYTGGTEVKVSETSYTFTDLTDGSYSFSVSALADSKEYKESSAVTLTSSIIIPVGEKFAATEVQCALSFSFNDEVSVGSSYYTKVTDATNLKAGDKIVITNKDGSMAMGVQNGNNAKGVTNTLNDEGNIETLAGGIQEITLEAGTKDNTFAFNTGSGYLYAASSSNNHLKTEETKSDNSSFAITFSNGTPTIIAQGTYTRNNLKYNSSSKLFSCYSGGQQDVAIYKLVNCTTTTFSNFSDLYMKFRYEFDFSEVDNVTESGLIVSTTNLFGGTDSDNEIYDLYASDTDRTRFYKNTDLKSSFIVSGAMSLDNADKQLTAVAYIKVGENYYFNKSKTYSVADMLGIYMESTETLTFDDGATFKISDIAYSFLDELTSTNE